MSIELAKNNAGRRRGISQRDCFVKVRLSPEELEQLDIRRETSPRSTFMRNCALHGDSGRTSHFECESIDRVRVELNRIGVNFNQISARVNSGDRAVEDELDDIRDGLERIYKRLNQLGDECRDCRLWNDYGGDF